VRHGHRCEKVRVIISLRAYRRLIAEVELRFGRDHIDPNDIMLLDDDRVEVGVDLAPDAYRRVQAEIARRQKLGLDGATISGVVEYVILKALEPSPGEEP
jgi:hypothetical protein